MSVTWQRPGVSRALVLLAVLACSPFATGSSYDAFYGSGRPGGGQPQQPQLGHQSNPSLADGFGDEVKPAGANGPIGSAVEDIKRRVDATKAMVHGAARHARWFNVANGLMLMVTAPFNVILSAITLKLTDVMATVYLSLFGCMLVLMELPLNSVQRPMREYFKFIYTRFGRAGFLLLVSNLAMVCSRTGFLTAALTLGNACLQLYLLGRQSPESEAEKEMLSSTMDSVRDEVTGELGSIMGPMKLLGGVGGGLTSWIPFVGGGRRRKKRGADDDQGEAFDNPFTGDSAAGMSQVAARETSAGQSAFGPGVTQGQGPHRGMGQAQDGPGGRSPFSSQPSGDAFSPFAPAANQGYPQQQQQQPSQQWQGQQVSSSAAQLM